MAIAPQTWKMLQGFQNTIQREVLVGGVSPFTAFSAADQVTYGANPNGTITNAIYLGVPIDLTTSYPYQCWITPTDETVKWRTNPRVDDWIDVYLCVLGLYKTNRYATFQQMIAIRDAVHPVIAAHAEQPNAPMVSAATWGPPGQTRNQGFFFSEWIGRDWLCWGATRKMRQEWNVSGNIQP